MQLREICASLSSVQFYTNDRSVPRRVASQFYWDVSASLFCSLQLKLNVPRHLLNPFLKWRWCRPLWRTMCTLKWRRKLCSQQKIRVSLGNSDTVLCCGTAMFQLWEIWTLQAIHWAYTSKNDIAHAVIGDASRWASNVLWHINPQASMHSRLVNQRTWKILVHAYTHTHTEIDTV